MPDNDEDWEDWLFEHDPKVIHAAESARERWQRGGAVRRPAPCASS